MEEDVEIEMLLKSNEAILMEAACLVDNENNVDNGKNTDNTSVIREDNEQLTKSPNLIEKKSCLDKEIVEPINSLSNNYDENSKPLASSSKVLSEQYNEYDIRTQTNVRRMFKEDECSPVNKKMLSADGDKTEKRNSVSENIELLLNIPQNKCMLPTTGKEIKTEKNLSDEVQELIEEHMVLKIAKGPNKSFLPITLSDSDEESLVSDDTYDINDDGDYFINEIMADEGPVLRGRAVEHIEKQIENNSKKSDNKILNELSQVQRLILDRSKLLKDFEIRLQEQLHKNEERQKELRHLSMQLTAPDCAKIKEPSIKKSFFKKFGMPYFKDKHGFTPPPNEEHKNKLERGELIITSVPKPRYWIKADKDLFQEAIKKTLIEENRARLVNEIQKLKKILDESSVDYCKDVLHEKIARCQDQLLSVSCKSYLELVSKEKPDREYDWMKYSVTEFNGQHSPDECRRFWHAYLKPSVNKSSWEVDEDYKLIEIAEQMKFQNWKAIAKLLGTNRTAYQCLVHFRTRIHTKHDVLSGKWTKEEDNKLLSVVSTSKVGDFIPWPKVASHMPNRNIQQIYNRYSNCLNPRLIKGRFTKDEDLLIVSGIEVFGMTYKEMSSLLNNRSCTQIRERYERYLLPKTAKFGTWSLEEDERLLKLVGKHGEKNWVAVADEMKTRSRTQARQRYAFIKKSMKAKPGWTVEQVKRRNIHSVSRVLSKTKRKVDIIKKKIEKVEKVFKLSELETDTFKIEKLKELKDKIYMKKFDLSRKKKVFSDSSEVNNLLLDYFKYYYKKTVEIKKLKKSDDAQAYLNEVLLMAKYFGHELQLPESEAEIMNNPRLNCVLKHFLLETLSNRKTSSVNKYDAEPPCSTSSVNYKENIDYIKLNENGEILMEDWWHTPPFDVTRLNFSEFFKRTVFDYSYGMHRDIWTSKLERSSVDDYSFLNEEPEQQLSRQQPFYIPPNLLTTLGLRSSILSRCRLKRDGAKKGLQGKWSHGNVVNEGENVEDDFALNTNLLNQFQETIVTLFTWPKVLSVTSIDSTSVERLNLHGKNSKPKKINRSNKNIDNLLNSSNDEVHYHLNVLSEYKPKPQKEKDREAILELNENRKRLEGECNRGVRYKRKMKIEHLADAKRKIGQREIKSHSSVKSKLKKGLSKKSQTQKDHKNMDCAKSAGQPTASNPKIMPKRSHMQEVSLQRLIIGDSIEDNSATTDYKHISMKTRRNTYSNTQKRGLVSNDPCEPVVKRAKRLCKEDGGDINKSESNVIINTKALPPYQELQMKGSSSDQDSGVGNIHIC